MGPKVISRLAAEAQAVLRAQDDVLWKSWTEGTPPDLAPSYAGHDKLFSLEAIRTVDRAQSNG